MTIKKKIFRVQTRLWGFFCLLPSTLLLPLFLTSCISSSPFFFLFCIFHILIIPFFPFFILLLLFFPSPFFSYLLPPFPPSISSSSSSLSSLFPSHGSSSFTLTASSLSSLFPLLTFHNSSSFTLTSTRVLHLSLNLMNSRKDMSSSGFDPPTLSTTAQYLVSAPLDS